jgi:hypothetical protein
MFLLLFAWVSCCYLVATSCSGSQKLQGANHVKKNEVRNLFNTVVSIGVVSFMVGCWLRPLAVAIAIVTPSRDGRDFVAARMNSP